MVAHFHWDLNRAIVRRHGIFRSGMSAAAIQHYIWPCKDGFVSYGIRGGARGAGTNKALIAWLDNEGMADDFLKAIDWDNLDMWSATQDFIDRMEAPIGRFFMMHTKKELYEGAIERGVQLHMTSSIKDLAENAQLAARDYWTTVDHPELEASITYPGTPVKNPLTPCYNPLRAPLIGEHNREIYVNELGFPNEEVTILKQAGII